MVVCEQRQRSLTQPAEVTDVAAESELRHADRVGTRAGNREVGGALLNWKRLKSANTP